jgi:hypothetical protein
MQRSPRALLGMRGAKTPPGFAKGPGGYVQVNKGVRGMPRLPEAKKDVPSCEKLWGPAQAV